MSDGPWQERLATWEARTAGVASVSSAVVTSPVRYPRSWASSRIVFRSRSDCAVVEMRPLLVLTPVAQPVPDAAESVTYSGMSGELSFTAYVVYSPVNGRLSIVKRPAAPAA